MAITDRQSEARAPDDDRSKNIVLCSDGTGNRDIKDRGTNVFKLYEAVDIQGHKNVPGLRAQVAFYDDGVGTGTSLPERILGSAFGFGFSRNVRELYKNLVRTYDPGDRLYLFGFSRGAYTVRALAGMILRCGILDRHRFPDSDAFEAALSTVWEHFEDKAFRRGSGVSEEILDDLALPGRKELTIEFIGVWDTVGAVGLPFDELTHALNWFFPRRFVELTPSPRINRACHALSIDDDRRTFHPSLWNERGARQGVVSQVWFAGVHSNVGGGYPKQGMSLVSLHWMMEEAKLCGLRFVPFDETFLDEHQDVHDKLYDARAGLGVYYRWSPRDIRALCDKAHIDKPTIHASVIERIAVGTHGYSPGNIPFDCTVAPDRSTANGRPTVFPSQRGVLELEECLRASNPQPTAYNCPMDPMRGVVKSGVLSYYVFLAATLIMLASLYVVIVGCYGTLFIYMLMVGLFALLGGAVSLWARRVDKELEASYANHWRKLRGRLHTALYT